MQAFCTFLAIRQNQESVLYLRWFPLLITPQAKIMVPPRDEHGSSQDPFGRLGSICKGLLELPAVSLRECATIASIQGLQGLRSPPCLGFGSAQRFRGFALEA